MVYFRGTPVHQVSYCPTVPAVSHGRFVARNAGDRSVEAIVRRVRVQSDQSDIPVDEFYVYELPDYEEVPGGRISIPPGLEKSFEVSFSAQDVPPGDVSTEIEVVCDGVAHSISSEWTPTIRTPKR